MPQSLQIKLKKGRLYFNLILGFVWIGLGFGSYLDGEPMKWLDYSHLVIGATFLCLFVYDIKHQYLTIENGMIKPNRLHGMKQNIRIDEIESISKKWGEYKIKTANESLTVSSQLMDNKSLEELKEFFKSLNLPDEKLAL